MIFNSIRAKIQLWYGIILAALLLAFGTTAFQLEKGRRFRRVDDQLQSRLNALMPGFRGTGPPDRRGPPGERFGPEGGRPRPEDETTEDRDRAGRPRPDRAGRESFRPPEFRLPPRQAALFESEETNGFYFIVWTRHDTELARSSNAPPALAKPATPRSPGPVLRNREQFREAYMGVRNGDVVLVGRSIAEESAELNRTGLLLVTVGAGVLLIGLAGGWWISTRAIKPIEQIGATALKISSGDLTQRIESAETESELGRLAGVLNSTFDRLETAFAHQAQFSSDVAHELRTPLAVMLTQTQGTLARERPATEYREALESCQRAAQRMRKLIELLLELARFDAGQEQLHKRLVDLREVINEATGSLQPLAAEKSVTIKVDLPELKIEVDPDRFHQVVTNLLSNAIHYNKPGGAITVTGAETEEMVSFTVSDTGIGMSAEERSHLFERFFRADKSRSAREGRTGLGLAITKAIVVAHSGVIDVRSTSGQGSSFTVRLLKGNPTTAGGAL